MSFTRSRKSFAGRFGEIPQISLLLRDLAKCPKDFAKVHRFPAPTTFLPGLRSFPISGF